MPKNVSLDEAALLVQQGTFPKDEFVRRMFEESDWALRYAQRILRSAADGEDAYQTVMTSIWRWVQDGKPIHHPKAFIAAAIRNSARTMLGRQGRRRTASLEDFEERPLELRQDLLPQELVVSERELLEILDMLKPGAKQIVIAMALKGLTAEETAATMNLSPASVRSTYFRARLRLAAGLKDKSWTTHRHDARTGQEQGV